MNHVISETFLSIEGEAKYTGIPTAYIRYARCNMKCSGFNNPTQSLEQDGYAPLPFDIIQTTSLDNVPEIEIGCDSQYAVNPKFSHIWLKLTVNQLAERIVDSLPNKSWIYPNTQQKVILSLTGGEPTLQWKIIPELLNHPLLDDLDHVLIETNCSVPINAKFIESLDDWLSKSNKRLVTWSNSPKLTISGEKHKKAIKPKVALDQMSGTMTNQYEQYFKFVCDDTDDSIQEVLNVMSEYYDGGVPSNVPIYIMPMCCTEQQQVAIQQTIAKTCIQHGFIYCHRVHSTVFGNVIGT